MRHNHLTLVEPVAPPAADVEPKTRRRLRIGRARKSTWDEPGFKHQFSCNCWPLMVRLIWWALRNDVR